MAVYAMGDLHLALDNPEKTMEVFGDSWKDYMNRIRENSSVVGEDDLYLLPGDLSWATYLEQADKDFEFINALPGKKVATRGNHDYWWGTVSKMNKILAGKGFDSITLLKSDAYVSGEAVVAGTRGWKRLEDDGVTAEDVKIHNREIERLKICLDSIHKADPEHKLPHILHLHGRAHAQIIEGERSGVKYFCVAADYLKYRPLRVL